MASKRKEEILKVALNLFNEKGVTTVTTNHIAAEMSISPGNLYYHFRNKEEIIRAIVEDMYVTWDVMYEQDPKTSFDLNALRQMLRVGYSLNWQFRFFYRDVSLILRADPSLKTRYFEMRDQRIDQQLEMVRTLSQAMLIDLPSEQDFRRILTAGWQISDNWLAFQELEEDWDEENIESHIEEGVEVLLALYKPYFKL
ncbi:MAG: TetR/AcrR family transcriptional regulator [Chloroflexota bacterium]